MDKKPEQEGWAIKTATDRSSEEEKETSTRKDQSNKQHCLLGIMAGSRWSTFKDKRTALKACKILQKPGEACAFWYETFEFFKAVRGDQICWWNYSQLIAETKQHDSSSEVISPQLAGRKVEHCFQTEYGDEWNFLSKYDDPYLHMQSRCAVALFLNELTLMMGVGHHCLLYLLGCDGQLTSINSLSLRLIDSKLFSLL